MTRFIRHSATRAAAALAVVLALAGPAAAAAPATLFAKAGYWTRFSDYWGGLFKQTNGITLIVVGAGIVSLFIITRGKWRK